MLQSESEIATSIRERYFATPIQLKDEHLQSIGEGGYVCDVYRISDASPLYGGSLLKVLRKEGLTDKKLRMFILNAEALQKADCTDGRIPKLLSKGSFCDQLAVVEELIPGVRSEEFDFYLQSLNPADRVRFYTSLTRLYVDLELKGIVHADPVWRNFAITPQMGAGLIDFGIAYVDGSGFNFLTRLKAQRQAIDELVKYIRNIELKACGRVAGVYRLKQISGEIQTLVQLAESVKELKAQ